jgi:hypothetical protein
MGINRDVHYAVESMEKRDRIGHKLAPPDVWGGWAAAIKSGEGERHGGLVSITMKQADLDDRVKGYIHATVQPSVRVETQAHRGIYVGINDHYEIADMTKMLDSNEIISLLERKFDDSIRRSEWIIDIVMRIEHG